MSWHEDDPAGFERLRQKLRDSYPTLHAQVRDGVVHVAGTFAVLAQEDQDDRYSIDVELPADYPNSLPQVWETAGRIERIMDRHVFPGTGALCAGVPIELWLSLKGDFSIENYLEKAVRPYLIGNSLFEEGQPWPFSESAHGSYGVLEFYKRHLGADDPRAIGQLLVGLIENKVRGHWLCPCGSKLPLRKCHGEQVRALKDAPPGMLSASVEHMMNILKVRAA